MRQPDASDPRGPHELSGRLAYGPVQPQGWQGQQREAPGQLERDLSRLHPQVPRRRPPQAVGYACPSLPTRGSARRSGYLYLGNYTINRPALPHYTEVLPRTLSLLRRSAEVAKRIADPRRHLDGRWLLMTDRIQIDDGTLEYDFEEDATAHDTGAVSHQRGERVAGANLLWAEGSVHWRPMPGKYQHQPLANTPSITGTEDGWARYGPPGPYIDIMCPIETLDIWYSDRGTDGWVRIAPRNAVAFSSPEIALER